VLKHPAFAGFPAEQPTRAWALALVRRATELFGEHNFPDGKGESFIIEDNVIWGNGKGGGGSLNLAGLQDSLVQNNLVYGNLNHGIAQWDEAAVAPWQGRVVGSVSVVLWLAIIILGRWTAYFADPLYNLKR
jgi:hypothetical protein